MPSHGDAPSLRRVAARLTGKATEMNKIYEQFGAAFSGVAGFAVLDDAGEYVAKVCFKHGRSNMRVTCFLHVIGWPMVKAYANGGGYDRYSAAAHSAVQKVKAPDESERYTNGRAEKVAAAFRAAIKDEGRHWNNDLEAAGFRVLSVI